MNGSAIGNWKLFPGSLRPNFAFACPACVEERGKRVSIRDGLRLSYGQVQFNVFMLDIFRHLGMLRHSI